MNPIERYKSVIIDAIVEHQVTVVIGETGSGKTTELPTMIYEEIDLEGGRIAITQPRRLAATSTAHFVAKKLGESVGETVGYRVRLDSRMGENTEVKFVTDGMLVSEMVHDPLLEQYSVVIVDEVHERSANIDILLGRLKFICSLRPTFRVVLASATVDANTFLRYFPDAACVEVPGRTYPVTIEYATQNYQAKEMVPAAIERIVRIHREEGPGDVLVFVPGLSEINTCIEELEQLLPPDEVVVLPAHGALAQEDLLRVIAPAAERRKVVIATNIAETSITIDGVVYVIDTGLINVATYQTWTNIRSLQMVEHSKAGLQQRAGRAGRTKPGVCYRLFTEENYQLRARTSTPEICRIDLTETALKLLSAGVADVRTFDFLTQPKPTNVEAALEELAGYGALLPDGTLSSIGERMSRLPLEPAVARMVIEATRFGCVEEVITVAAFLSSKDVFLTPRGEDGWRYRHTHQRRFKDVRADTVMYLRIWREWESKDFSLDWCDWRYLSRKSMQEVKRVREQLYDTISHEEKITSNDSQEAIQKAVAAGFVKNLLRRKDASYEGVLRDIKNAVIHPGSGMARSNPLFVVCAEVMKTSRVFAKMVIEVPVHWLPELVPDQFYFMTVRGADGVPGSETHIMMRTGDEYDVFCGVAEKDVALRSAAE